MGYACGLSMSEPRVLKVFVASPSDVVDERNALAKLIGDINDVILDKSGKAVDVYEIKASISE